MDEKAQRRFLIYLILLLLLLNGDAWGNDLDTLTAGRWIAVGTNTLSSVAQSPVPGATLGGGPLSRIMNAWGGGAYDTSRNHLLIFGGGGQDYAGNEVYSFDVGNTLAWSKLSTATTDANMPAIGSMVGAGPGQCGASLYADNLPASTHSYNLLNYVPSLDAMLMYQGAVWCTDFGTVAAHRFNLSSNTWGTAPANLPATPIQSAHDPVTNRVYMANTTLALTYYNVAGNSYTTISGSTMKDIHDVCALDPGRRLFVCVGYAFGTYYWNIDTGVQTTPTTTGAKSIPESTGDGGIDYSFSADRFVFWPNGGSHVYTLNPDTWAWVDIAPAAGNSVVPTNAAENGTFSRWRYVKSKDVFVVVNAVDQSVYGYKLAPQTPTFAARNTSGLQTCFPADNKHIASVYDSTRHVVYYWGGDYTALSSSSTNQSRSHEEFWKYDLFTGTCTLLANQTAMSTTGFPQGRCVPQFVYDPTRQVIWMQGGQNRAPASGDGAYPPALDQGGLFAFDVNPVSGNYLKWRKAGPALNEHSGSGIIEIEGDRNMLYDAAHDRLVVIAYSGGSGPQVWTYSLTGITYTGSQDNWTLQAFLTLDDSTTGIGENAAHDTLRNRLIRYSAKFGKTTAINLTTFAETLLTSVPPTISGAACPFSGRGLGETGPCHRYSSDYDSVNDIVAFFGGMNGYDEDTSDLNANALWLFNLTTNTWTKSAVTGIIPGQRQAGTMAFDSQNNYLLQNGGCGECTTVNPGFFPIRLGGIISATSAPSGVLNLVVRP